MLTKEKALYQAKLIIECLPKEEYDLLPKDYIEYIQENYEYDENITIDPQLPLENQQIDDATCEILDELTKNVDFSKLKLAELDEANSADADRANREKDEEYILKIENENIRLNELIELLKKENLKIPKAKSLIEEYKQELQRKNEEIKKLQENNQALYDRVQKIPKFLRRFFIKDEEMLYLK